MSLLEAIRAMFSPDAPRSLEDRGWPDQLVDPPQQPTDEDVAWARLEAEALVRRARALDVDLDYERLGRRQVVQ